MIGADQPFIKWARGLFYGAGIRGAPAPLVSRLEGSVWELVEGWEGGTGFSHGAARLGPRDPVHCSFRGKRLTD